MTIKIETDLNRVLTNILSQIIDRRIKTKVVLPNINVMCLTDNFRFIVEAEIKYIPPYVPFDEIFKKKNDPLPKGEIVAKDLTITKQVKKFGIYWDVSTIDEDELEKYLNKKLYVITDIKKELLTLYNQYINNDIFTVDERINRFVEGS